MTTATIDVKALNGLLAEKRKECDRLVGTFKTDEKGRFDLSREQFEDYRKTVREAEEIKGLIDATRAHESFGAYLDGSDESSEAARNAALPRGGDMESKSLGDLFVESEALQRARERGFDDSASFTTRIEGKSIFNFSAGTVTTQALGSVQNLGISEMARRRMHIRDLFPKSSTKAAVLSGLRETGWVNRAKQIRQRTAADGTSPATGSASDKWGRVPKSELTLKPVLFPIAEIGHALDAHKNILSDDGRLKTFINNRMVEGVKYTEDWDLLHSVGDGEHLTGFFETEGIQTYDCSTADKWSVQIRRAVTKAMLAEYEPSGIILSPTMWEHVEVEEDKNGQFRVAVAVAIGAEKRVWRLQLVETTAMSDDFFMLGAFGMGAQLHDRESVSVRVSSENATNFEDGIVTFRADERVALEIVRPESFVIGKWAVPA
ncbi:MAG TPA: phage major capsid protein [Kineosporiaceae bacterium]|nr:phage major capsid protein [Kineosporiaceae bacterium]